MSFSGNPTALIEHPITNDGFWPDLELSEFQKGYRLPAEYLVEMLVEGLVMAMGEINLDLARRQQQFHAAGISVLACADPQLLIQHKFPDRLFLVTCYKRAVYCRAKAFLLSQFATVNRRDSAQNLAKEAPETASAFLTFSQQAVRLIQGRSRITSELI
ncbi:hypothetical protein HDC30_005767 [Pseudomonas sp. JAI115]|uniref:head completion/stabilization protein n=1 Tax=Pseudomonas sp. JAI115 TaxID=2723061 RepID=UPI00160C0B36|nr:head completion/stabilization protein [Pseudomonas sp. JAI115]MBB6158509.1 hypothetical protein [Pseudomonas sp. JAI115]